MDAGGIEVGHQRGDEGVVRLMRDGGGFGAVVVTGEHQHAAVLGRARGIAVAEHVAAAVDAGALAVPDADCAIIFGAGRQIELLRAPDRGGREVLVHAGLELDVVLLEMFSGGKKLLVIAAQRRAAVAGDKACGVQPCGTVTFGRMVPPDPHEQPRGCHTHRQDGDSRKRPEDAGRRPEADRQKFEAGAQGRSDAGARRMVRHFFISHKIQSDQQQGGHREAHHGDVGASRTRAGGPVHDGQIDQP